MSKTIELRKALQNKFLSICNNVSYEETTDTTTFPYLVYEIESVGEYFQVEVNVYDKGTSSVKVEELADHIEQLFKREVHRDSSQFFTTDINKRNIIKEKNKSLKRRRLLIDLIYYGKDD